MAATTWTVEITTGKVVKMIEASVSSALTKRTRSAYLLPCSVIANGCRATYTRQAKRAIKKSRVNANAVIH